MSQRPVSKLSSMIDRMFALWQAVYPDSYVEPQRQWTPSFWYENGTVMDADSGNYRALNFTL
jgi:hypothetical protein